MTAPTFTHAICETIRAAALALPEVSEGSSCVNRAFKAGGKNFAFLGEKGDAIGLRLKLGPSFEAIAARAQAEPDRYEAGKFGWVMLRFGPDTAPEDVTALLVESYRQLAPKRLIKLLDGQPGAS